MVEFFIKGLEEKAKLLNVESYLEIGFQNNDIEELRQSFFPTKKKDCEKKNDDPISELIQCYEHSLDNIVYFEFAEDLQVIKDKYLVFGYYDDNPLVIDKNTNEVLNLNAYDGPEILYKCAADPSKFLAATLENIHTEPIINKFKNKKEERAYWAAIASKSIEKAGGPVYKNFYEMVCDISVTD